MKQRGIISIANEYGEKAAESLGYELVDVEYVKEQGNFFLRIYIDKDGWISLDDCQRMTELISEDLDREDPVEEPYYLEISSPGLDRPLKTDKDYKRNLEKEVEVKLYKALDDRKKFEGVLKGYDDEQVFIELNEEKTLNIPREIISLMRLVIKF